METYSAMPAAQRACRDQRMACAATRAANAGATVAQLEAIFGWTGGTIASLYTRAADRERLAREAMHMLANEKRTSIPSPKHKVGAREQKQQ